MIILSILLGWFCAGLVNWAADVLPHWHADPPPQRAITLGNLAHYWTLGWYPWRRGICPHCNQARAWRAPVVEVVTILLFIFAGTRFAEPWLGLLVAWLYTALLVTVAVIDFEQRRVLNLMLIPAYPIAFVCSWLLQQDPWLLLLGGAGGFAIYFILALVGRGALGMGDVKLAGLIGLMVGYPAVISALLAGIFAAGIAAILLLVTRRAGRKSHFAYAPYMAVGALLAVWSMLARL